MRSLTRWMLVIIAAGSLSVDSLRTPVGAVDVRTNETLAVGRVSVAGGVAGSLMSGAGMNNPSTGMPTEILQSSPSPCGPTAASGGDCDWVRMTPGGGHQALRPLNNAADDGGDRVGIGTGAADPDATLHLESNEVNRLLLLLHNTNDNSSLTNPGVPIYLSSGPEDDVRNVVIENNNHGSFGIRTGGIGDSDAGADPNPTHWGPFRLFIQRDSGNVGIGTNVPDAKLQVAGTLHADGTVRISDLPAGSPDDRLVVVDASGVLRVVDGAPESLELDALQAEVDSLTGRVDDVEAHNGALEDRIVTLEARVADLEHLEARVAALEDTLTHVSRDGDQLAVTGATVVIDGGDLRIDAGNLHVRNGEGSTASTNGLGNVIVGYNEARGVDDDRTGSHNIVMGSENNHAKFGGLVSGVRNTISAPHASVLAGDGNTSAGTHAVVIGGNRNQANGPGSAVLTGTRNQAKGPNAIALGGGSNAANGVSAAVLGGVNAEASGWFATIAGGQRNIVPRHSTSGIGFAAVFGGQDNVASGGTAVVTGGVNNSAVGEHAVVSGGSENEAGARASAVGGGRLNRSTGHHAMVTGGAANLAAGEASAVTGGAQNKAYGKEAAIHGGAFNRATGTQSTVSGGDSNTATGARSTVGGGLRRSVTGTHHWRAGHFWAMR